jgi:hypothetical protein
MLDYYSNTPMPDIEERKNNLLIFAKTLNSKLKEKEIEQIVLDIVKETPDYSLTGYAAFGKNEEIKKLKIALN